MYVFRIYAFFESSNKTGFDVYLSAKNEDEAMKKVKKVVSADKFCVREVSEKLLWLNSNKISK